jgi:tetratricopeptide (TPR) repeat protein
MAASPTAIPQLMQSALQHQAAHNFPMAEALYRQVLERQPRNADALHFLGLILYVKKDETNKQEGLKLIDKSLKLSPGNQDFIFKRSLLYIDCQDWGNAERLCNKLIAVNPTFSGGYFNLANVFASSGRFEEAEARIRKAIHMHF